MRRSLNTFQAMEQKHKGETNPGLSETIPGQAVSAPELLRRFATGQPLGFKNVEAVYDDPEHDSVPEFYKLNKLDRLHFLQENTERVKEARENLKLYQQELQLQQQQKQLKKAEQESKGDLKTPDLNKRSTSSENKEG